ncbi:phosphoribosyltransferase [Paenibacillus rhizovicinus]|uniref:Phosphoribosyltransferase n=1 Tax=Paenibacillus rhizovicinus TaxID=2704463 RepID=A0A6C0P6X3_9BACL|nr:phosphoribosyltransferase [Paenibacillus rhizovicinus]QHW34264.1 phosphoribosyltransferase [Paenibacillus rhizovicinus]
MSRNIYLDYNSLSLRLDALSVQIMEKDYDGLVILLRGGYFIGLHLAFLTGLPYYFVKYERSSSSIAWEGAIPSGTRLLLCEDFAGSGDTLTNTTAFIESFGKRVDTLVGCSDLHSSSVPTFACFHNSNADARFIFPWERHRMNKEGRQAATPDHGLDKTAWDLDGVFLEDVPSEVYRAGLDQALLIRDGYTKAHFAPTRYSSQDMIITGRPECDRERTLIWLNNSQIHLEATFRDDNIEKPTKEETAAWKGKRAIELGFNHFVESCPIQALHIANLYPEMRVIWWNSGEPLRIQATKHAESRLEEVNV